MEEGEVLKNCRLSKFRDYRIYFWGGSSNVSCVSSEIQQEISQLHRSLVNYQNKNGRTRRRRKILKICRLSRFRRLWNVECYVMYFWGGSFKMHNVSRVSSVGGISSTNRCWGGASPRRQHLFSRRRRRRREGLPLFHLHSRLLSLPPSTRSIYTRQAFPRPLRRSKNHRNA